MYINRMCLYRKLIKKQNATNVVNANILWIWRASHVFGDGSESARANNYKSSKLPDIVKFVSL